MKNVTIKIEAEALLKLIELGYGFEVIGNTHIPGVLNVPEPIVVPQFIQPYFSELPVVNVPKYNVVNLGNIVVNYLLEMKRNQQHNKNADAFHSNRTSGIYHNVLNYQYFNNMLVASWKILAVENDTLELHHPDMLGYYLSVHRGDLFYHYLDMLIGEFTKQPITACSVIKPAAKILLDSAIEWGSDNPVAALSYSNFDVAEYIQAQCTPVSDNDDDKTQPTDNKVITSNEIVRAKSVFVTGVPVKTKPVEPVPNNVDTAIVQPADPEQVVDKITVPDDAAEVEAATDEPVSLEDKCVTTIETVITIVEDYVNARKEKKRNTKLYTSQLSAISNAFDFTILRLNAATDLSAIKQYEHKLNILKDELNCLNISIVSNIENPLYYVNTLLKYYK